MEVKIVLFEEEGKCYGDIFPLGMQQVKKPMFSKLARDTTKHYIFRELL